MSEHLTLYAAKICPFAHRVELALEEAKIDYTRFEVDLDNKPEWYTSQVNPAGKVPAITYGGPKVAPNHPSPYSVKLAESAILLEFVADLSGKLLPKDPVLRAKARFFIETVPNSFILPFYGAFMQGAPVEDVLVGIEKIQALLTSDGYAISADFTIADAAIAPLFARFEVSLKGNYGTYDEGVGIKTYEMLQLDPKYARYRKYLTDLKARDSFKKTFDEAYVRENYAARRVTVHGQRRVVEGSP